MRRTKTEIELEIIQKEIAACDIDPEEFDDLCRMILGDDIDDITPIIPVRR